MSLVPPSHREGLRNNADSYEKLNQRIKLRQDTAANWSKNDPVLESGEFGYEIGYPTGKIKIGTGSTRWSQLPYLMERGLPGTPGLPGPAGPPGKGIQIKGVADVWPPAGTPESGDLWILDDPIPPTAPAGSAPGDGYVWSGTKWVSTGPIRGPEGEPGKDGAPGKDGTPGQNADPITVFSQAAQPVAINAGDLWIKPVNATTAELYVWNGVTWFLVGSTGSGSATINTLGNPVGLTPDAALSLQQWSEEIALKAAFKDTGVNFARVQATSPDWSPGDVFGNGNVIANGGAFGELWYGSLLARDGKMTSPGYQMPTPTGDGYLRSDLDPSTGWYFAEPVLISGTEPPAPTGGNAIWVDPTASPTTDPNLPFSNANPPVYADPAVTTQPNGLPIGLSADGLEIHQPYMVGGVPVLIGGKTYLLPLIEAPASALPMTPLFSFDDQPTTQQLDGTWIGLTPDGQFVYQPQMVGGIPVVVGGKTFLIPIVEQ